MREKNGRQKYVTKRDQHQRKGKLKTVATVHRESHELGLIHAAHGRGGADRGKIRVTGKRDVRAGDRG